MAEAAPSLPPRGPFRRLRPPPSPEPGRRLIRARDRLAAEAGGPGLAAFDRTGSGGPAPELPPPDVPGAEPVPAT